MSDKKINISILGVSHVSDLYPNVKYKIIFLESLSNLKVINLVYDLGEGGFYQDISHFKMWHKLKKIFKQCWGHLRVFFGSVTKHNNNVYITYPGIFLINLFYLIPKKIRPTLYLDAFISIYDTAVNDRKMLDKSSHKAKLLYYLERKAFLIADYVITDTQQNSIFYSSLYQLPESKFFQMPLCIPPLNNTKAMVKSGEKANIKKFSCLFIGSLVPLHGIEVILKAAEELKGLEGIEFRIIGSGQDQHLIAEYLASSKCNNVHWEEGFFPTEYIVKAMLKADVCLGVFGQSDKADRVFPYKLYYYSQLGKPFINLQSTCLKAYCEKISNHSFMLVNDNEESSLSALIKKTYENPELLSDYSESSSFLFENCFSHAIIEKKFRELFSLPNNDVNQSQ